MTLSQDVDVCRYGMMGLGAGYHTLTLRPFPANLEYKIVNHAEDQNFNA